MKQKHSCSHSLRLFSIIASLAFLLIFVPVNAWGKLTSGYAVLDADKVIRESTAYIEFRGKLDKINSKYQKEIEFYESQLVELDKKIRTSKKSGSSLVQDKQKIILYESKVQELMQKRKDINDNAQDKAFGVMRDTIEKIVYDFAKENKLEIIFSRTQTMYFSDKIDITEPVLAELNKKLLKLDVDTAGA